MVVIATIEVAADVLGRLLLSDVAVHRHLLQDVAVLQDHRHHPDVVDTRALPLPLADAIKNQDVLKAVLFKNYKCFVSVINIVPTPSHQPKY